MENIWSILLHFEAEDKTLIDSVLPRRKEVVVCVQVYIASHTRTSELDIELYCCEPVPVMLSYEFVRHLITVYASDVIS